MAFDALAPIYDRDFTASSIAQHLRARVRARLARHFQAGMRVLELGCGTGEDALWLGERGVYVTATDSSAAMLAITHAKTAHLPHITTALLNINELQRQDGMPQSHKELGEVSFATLLPSDLAVAFFDGVYANFGVLNCAHDLPALAAWLAERVTAGRVAAFGVMSRACAFEFAWHAAHGDWRTATRRWRGVSSFQPDSSAPPMTIHYPTIRALKWAFAPHFHIIHLEPLGLFLPPSDVYGAVERRPRLLRALCGLDDRFGRWRGWAALADHYWIELRRR